MTKQTHYVKKSRPSGLTTRVAACGRMVNLLNAVGLDSTEAPSCPKCAEARGLARLAALAAK